MDLCKREKAQPRLFEDRDLGKQSNRLMTLMDEINQVQWARNASDCVGIINGA